MKRTTSRRAFIAAAVTSGVAVAGCSQLQGSTDGNETSATSPTDDGSGTPNGGGTETQDYHYTDRGSVLDDFEDLSNWGTIRGTQIAETNDVYKGDQSVRVKNPSGGGAGIFRAFPDGLDLTDQDLSIAGKLESPRPGKLAVEVIAPARSDHLVCRRYIPDTMDDWMRIDLGYTGKRGEPDLSNVQEIRLIVLSDDEPINFVVDDLRTIPKPVDSGRVLLSFNNVRASHYDIAFQELQRRGWSAMETVDPDEVNSNNALTTGQLREMRDAGWDITSLPSPNTPLPELSTKEQRRVIKDTKEYLDLKGFTDGKQFMTIDSDKFDRETLQVIRDHHEYGFTFGASPNTVPPVENATVSQVYGNDLNGSARMINLAAQYNQLAVITFPDIGPNSPVPESEFMQLMNIIEDWGDNLQVVTPSDLLEMEQNL
ncbi:hypothetical protein BV210_17805 (plasmid) [Halorientalis sp. IM1011]|uniref:polysaccharide deacetylase family protein n=1 Tax=Halorientalis sp. IM1011 TaxID=1932360 RepID=UPI00097CD41A|nr:hypothetical protein [Halorientalis sp. IM1011]AQL44626.1 hypothetical protein BV210_17805 [Halorientalis sp. IM1011]